MNTKELLDSAKAGDLSVRQIDEVGRLLQAGGGGEDPYTLLHILGRAKARKFRLLVEKYLVDISDPMMTRLALQIVCMYWNETPEHLDALKRFVGGVEEDPENDVRMAAISCAGEYLRANGDALLLSQLYRAFRSENEPQTIREAAYLGMARAMGRDWQALPPASRHFDLDRDVDPDVLERVEALSKS